MARKKGGDHGGGGGHDAAGGMRWLLTYSDLVTLLLILFIMLYSMSKIDAAKFKELAQLLRAAFGGVLTQGPTFLQGSGDQLIPDLVPRLAAAVEGAGGGREVAKVFRNERGIVVRLMTDNVLFDPASTELKPEMKSILDALAGPLRDAGRPVAVEGHTDDLRMRGGGRYVSNWELSSERATQVVRYLIEKGRVPPASLSAAGYAEFHPVVPNTGAASRTRNRRIDIVILEGVGEKAAPAGGVTAEAGTPAIPAAPSALPAVPSASAPPAPPVPGRAAPPLPGAPPVPSAPPLPGGK
ncbi:MAG: flagellar motor protein MotB [Candidatus Coatesbacteria bacterium]